MTLLWFFRTKNQLFLTIGLFDKLVHLAGIEPVRVAPLDPKSSASASSAIGASACLFYKKLLLITTNKTIRPGLLHFHSLFWIDQMLLSLL